MKIERSDEQTVSIGPLDLLCCELLHQIRVSAEPGESEAARARLFPSPSGGEDRRLDRDWQEYIEPDLAHLFESHLDVIDGDLEKFPGDQPEAEGYTLHIPMKNLDAWIHGLNQARLSLSARHNFTEDEMNGRIPDDGDVRALTLFQVHFYALLQECFLRVLGSD
jgi:hypothetical protein